MAATRAHAATMQARSSPAICDPRSAQPNTQQKHKALTSTWRRPAPCSSCCRQSQWPWPYSFRAPWLPWAGLGGEGSVVACLWGVKRERRGRKQQTSRASKGRRGGARASGQRSHNGPAAAATKARAVPIRVRCPAPAAMGSRSLAWGARSGRTGRPAQSRQAQGGKFVWFFVVCAWMRAAAPALSACQRPIEGSHCERRRGQISARPNE